MNILKSAPRKRLKLGLQSDSLTKEIADKIVELNPVFKSKETILNGFKVVQYAYGLASLKDFLDPAPGILNGVNALELRGLTFVEQPDGTWKKFLMLHKFFGLNQTDGYMYKDVKDKDILEVSIKEDGSMIRFIDLPDGTIHPKTKFNLDCDQTLAASYLVNKSRSLSDFIKESLSLRRAAIFEFVSPENRVVVEYKESELILLQLRDELTGEYIPIHDDHLVKKYGIKCSQTLSPIKTLEEYMELAKTEVGYEGWVISLPGQMLKLKLDEYYDLHGIFTSLSDKENCIVSLVLGSTSDDLLSKNLPQEKRDYILEIEALISHEKAAIESSVKSAVDSVKGLSRKEIAMKYSKTPYFGIIMKSIDNYSMGVVDKMVTEFLLKKNKTLTSSREYLKSKGLKLRTPEWVNVDDE